jgi:hypothetical protein
MKFFLFRVNIRRLGPSFFYPVVHWIYFDALMFNVKMKTYESNLFSCQAHLE